MRDRLIEIIKKVPYGVSVDAKFEQHFCEKVADCLLENGVIVPPVKVGQTVYRLDNQPCDLKCISCEWYSSPYPGDCASCDKTITGNRAVECIDIVEQKATQHDIYWWLCFNNIGKTVFLTKEQAEKALAEVANGT